MLDLVVVPGKSVGDFYLGMPISEAVKKIQGELLITQAELKYHELDPLSSFIIIDLTDDGILLSFEPISQRLQGIEIYRTVKLKLRYSGAIFCSPESDLQPTMGLIDEIFGPSFPGDYEKEQHQYNVHYPGLTFCFPIPPEYDSIYANPHEQPLELPNGRSPITSKIVIYYGPKLSQASLPPLDPDSLYFEQVDVSISEGVYFTKRDCFINFNSSTQDVVSDLGPPDKIYFKEQDKMKIHLPGSQNGTKGTEYFYNYFSLGIDILFDVNKHTVKKIILHSNFPSHYDFNRYTKCNFRIVDDDNNPLVNVDATWDDVKKVYGESGKPVVHKRKFPANPFGSTFFYGYRDVIFEIMTNNHISSVCLFKSNSQANNLNNHHLDEK
eukprot:TRINITY_DN4255_c0_g1_i1.p1 TRINITY_DN4255_c0_g1~~TRINITY_DN4255_c0_g1_i1.p1  ORF type:complete len:382 (-),score=69.32 TRINITY_DN4255_c0_g1_i1:122-1267(-)